MLTLKHVWSLTFVKYLVDWLTLKGKGCCQQDIVTAESAGTVKRYKEYYS